MFKGKPERQELIAFVRKYVSDISEQSTLEELQGGYLNFVWRIHGAAGKCYIIKHAPPFIAAAPEIPFDNSRMLFEERILKAFRSRSELKAVTGFGVRPPELIGSDRRAHLLLMEDVGSLPDLRRVVQRSDYSFRALGSQLGKFIALLHARTHRSDWFYANFVNLPVQQTRLQVQYNGCLEFCRKAGFADADKIGRRCRQLGEKFNSAGKCLIMGDLWPSSILVSHNEIRLIDWELTHYGRPAQDVAHLSAHLWMMAHRSAEHSQKERISRFRRAFLKGYHDTLAYQKSEVFTGEDGCEFQIHFGAEILARTVGAFQNNYLYNGLSPDHPIIQEATAEARYWISGQKHMSDLWG